MRYQKGFTLLETLIALVLMSLLIMALFGGFRAGIRSWQAAENHVQWVEEPRQLSALLYRHLNQFIPVMTGQSSHGYTYIFAGEPERLLYVAPLSLSVGDKPYIIELINQYDGQAGLWARFAPLVDDASYQELLDQAEYTQISENVSAQFVYFFAQGWVDTLPDGQVPTLVKVNLTIKSQQDWPSLVFAVNALGAEQ